MAGGARLLGGDLDDGGWPRSDLKMVGGAAGRE